MSRMSKGSSIEGGSIHSTYTRRLVDKGIKDGKGITTAVPQTAIWIRGNEQPRFFTNKYGATVCRDVKETWANNPIELTAPTPIRPVLYEDMEAAHYSVDGTFMIDWKESRNGRAIRLRCYIDWTYLGIVITDKPKFDPTPRLIKAKK